MMIGGTVLTSWDKISVDIDVDDVRGLDADRGSIKVEHESYAGSGYLAVTFFGRDTDGHAHAFEVIISPDDALTLSNTLALYAQHSQRTRERFGESCVAVEDDATF
jgi:hypothetical protein